MTTSPEAPAKGLNPILRIVLAILLLVPAMLCCASQDIGPSVMTFVTSLQKITGLGIDSQFIGFENYTRILGDRPFLSALGFTVQIIIVRLLAVSILPLLIGLGLSAVGKTPRRIIRAILVVPLALFVPVAIGITWRLLTSPVIGPIDAPVFGQPDTAGLALLFIDGLSVLGIAVAAGAWLYPSASTNGRAGVVVILVVLLLAAIASGLQTFTLMSVTTGGGPVNSTTTLMLLMNNLALRNFQFGAGAAVGTVILIPVLILGVIAGLVIILSRVALMPVEAASAEAAATEPPANRQPVRLVLLLVGLVPALACCAISALPLPWVALQSFGGDSFAEFFQVADLGPVLMNTLLPAFVSAFLIELPIALAAAFAIGGLRPIGKHSEWLLLLFSPGLFLTIAPIMVPVFQGLMATERIGEFTAFFTPLALSVPLLFLLTLFFKGHTVAKPEATPVQLLVRSLPLAFMASAVLFFVHLNEFLWPYLLARSPENYPFVLLIGQLSQGIGDFGTVAAAITLFWLPMFIVFVIVFGVCLVLYGDRLALKRDVKA